MFIDRGSSKIKSILGVPPLKKKVWKHCSRGTKSDINGASETASRLHEPRALSSHVHNMSRRWSCQNRWLSAAEAHIRSWWSSWSIVSGQSGIGTDYFRSTLTLLCPLTIPPVLHIHTFSIWAIKGHSSKSYSIILPQEIKYHSEWWNKEIAYSGLLGAILKLHKATTGIVIVCLSVCHSVFPWNKSAPTGRIFMKFYIWLFFFFSKICWENERLDEIWQV